MKDRSSTQAVLIAVALSLLFGFLMLRGDKPVGDSVKYGAEGALKLRELNIRLHQER